MYYGLYTLLGWLFIICAIPFFIPYCVVTGKHLEGLTQRFGLYKINRVRRHKTRIWLHAASVGEVEVAKALITEYRRTQLKADFILTTVTHQGQLMAQAQLDSDALCLYAPLDLPWVVSSVIRKLRPTAYVCLETELWPNILRTLRACNVKTILLNGRMSDKSFNSYKKFIGFSKQVLNNLDAIAVITDGDKQHYADLGYPRDKIVVTGNAKYSLRDNTDTDAHNAEQCCENIAHYRKLLNINGHEQVLVAGSTHSGEEILLAQLHADLSASIENFILIIAPRHIERAAQIGKQLSELGIEHQTFSHIQAGEKRHSSIVVLDVMGKLRSIYSIATYVFCGGSLVEKGGHNIMEAAIQGKAPVYGPHMKDFSDAVKALENHDAGFMVTDITALRDLLCEFTRKPETLNNANRNAKAVALAQQGAAGRQIALLQNLLATIH